MNVNRFLWVATTTLFLITGALAGWALGTFYTAQKIGDSPIVAESMRSLVIGTIVVGMSVVMARVGASLGNRVSASFSRIHEMSIADRVLGICGLLLGLLFGVLITIPLDFSNTFSNAWTVPLINFCIMAVSAMLGMALLQGMRSEMLRVFPALDEATMGTIACSPKFLDTNVIIDGRIADICRTGFIEGPVWVPSFVLHELQYIADSSDSMRRARGRRGLETLNAMRNISLARKLGETPQPAVEVLTDISAAVMRVETVDAKLVALAKEKSGSILTNDYNLNRVAELQGVTVLNINQLALALKPVVLPGEEMTITIVREGKEAGQGIGYLEDGTMVVVNEGRNAIGETCRVTIAQVLQTVAGKMIFGDLKERENRHDLPSEMRESARLRGAGDDLFSGNGHEREEQQSQERRDGREGNDFTTRAGGGVRRKNRTER
ncbi:MAG TPA: PIN domain-containing protein [Abditibacteriaceae bacterium]|jgi:uncharacterized protein YacL